MGSFFAAIWDYIVGAVGVLWPASRHAIGSPVVRWFLHLLLLAAILVGLYYLNGILNIAPTIVNLWVRPIYLPVLFLLIYAIAWIAWWVWKLVAFEEDVSYFPDIDAAWNEAMYALGQAGIHLPDVPLFLILGRPETSNRNLFEASRLNLVVKQAPPDPHAPIHVYADREGVYVTCVGASLLGRLAGIIALEEMGQAADEEGTRPEIDVTKTLIPTKKESQIVEDLDESAGGELSTLARRRLRRQIGKAIGPDILADPHDVQRLSDRLAHLCRLILRDRQPYCPLNGILVLVPLGASDTKEDAHDGGEACRLDLQTLQNTLRLDCPVFSLVCDLEALPGFREFMRRQDPANWMRRLGQRFPLATSLKRDELLEQVQASIRWLCNEFIQESIYKYFQVETAELGDASSFLAGNSSLFLMLDEFRARGDRLASIIAQALTRDDGRTPLYGGCYLAATGERDSQAFVHGLFDRMIKEQNSVTWTDEALGRDAADHATARIGYLWLWGMWLVIIAAIGWGVWKGPWRQS